MSAGLCPVLAPGLGDGLRASETHAAAFDTAHCFEIRLFSEGPESCIKGTDLPEMGRIRGECADALF
jgi:hypothetical protein